MTPSYPLKRCLRLLGIALLTLVILSGAGCGDEGFIVISMGNGIIVFTPHSSAITKLPTGQAVLTAPAK